MIDRKIGDKSISFEVTIGKSGHCSFIDLQIRYITCRVISKYSSI